MKKLAWLGFAFFTACSGVEASDPASNPDRETYLGAEEVEPLCEQWCSNDVGCETGVSDPSACSRLCRNELAGPCSIYKGSALECWLALGCEQAADCAGHHDESLRCGEALVGACDACEAQTPVHKACDPAGADFDAWACRVLRTGCQAAEGNCEVTLDGAFRSICEHGERAGLLEEHDPPSERSDCIGHLEATFPDRDPGYCPPGDMISL